MDKTEMKRNYSSTADKIFHGSMVGQAIGFITTAIGLSNAGNAPTAVCGGTLLFGSIIASSFAGIIKSNEDERQKKDGNHELKEKEKYRRPVLGIGQGSK